VADGHWQSIRGRTRNHEGFARGARALVALGGVLALGWPAGWDLQFMPMLLGVIASALSESDDGWPGRLRAQLIALGVFAALGWAVPASQPWPWAQALLLSGAALGLTLLGALGERYAAIALGSMVFGIYTALVAHGGTAPMARATPLMLAGAAWYGLVSVAWAAAWPQAPVRHRLSRLYALLGEQLRLKALLLEPVRDVDLEGRRMALALHNGRVVLALNAAKDSLFNRLPTRGPRPPWLQAAMRQYLAAQDVHERVNSSHEHYALLAESLFHSDLLYRCQRVLTVLGEQSLKFAEAIQHQALPDHAGSTTRAIEDLHLAIDHLATEPALPARTTRAVQALARNLTAMAQVLARLHQPASAETNDPLWDRQPRGWLGAGLRLLAQLRTDSPLLRHAVRLSLALLAGQGVMALTQDPHGYWILLTVLFVSQPRYADTLRRVLQRAGGTALGLCVGWALIRLFPDPLLQSGLLALAGALFLGARQTRYVLATASVSVMLLLSFHQTGMGEGVIPARMLDTVVGGGIAWLAAWLLLPNWQARQWPRLAAQSLRAQAHYLREIAAQFQAGKQDHLAYRLARRNAHNADAALSNAYAAMLKEPARARGASAQCGQFLIVSHTLLNYLSALGAHRGSASVGGAGLEQDAAFLSTELLALADQLLASPSGAVAAPSEVVPGGPEGFPADTGAAQQLQLWLALRLLPELRRQAAHMARGLQGAGASASG
jgi:YccS/YhfK family integral membrane protein